MPSTSDADYWTSRYQNHNTGWDIGYPSTPLREYIDQLTDKSLRILIPGAGNAYEAEYLHQRGFTNVHVLDISPLPLERLRTLPIAIGTAFPTDYLHEGDFFEHTGQYDLVLEQTFFCALEPTPENRAGYARKMSELIVPGGKLVGLWFRHPLDVEGKRPFGGSREEYLGYLEPYFTVKTFAEAHNSIGPRMGNELFGIFSLLSPPGPLSRGEGEEYATSMESKSH